MIMLTEHILVHTGQNFTASLSEVFFQELNVRQPDYILANQQLTLGEQLSKMYKELRKYIFERKNQIKF